MPTQKRKGPGQQPQQPTSSEQRVPLEGSERLIAPDARAIGAPDADARMEISVRLRPRHEVTDSELETLGRTPPRDRSVPSRRQFAQRHGADPADIERVREFATAHGLEVVDASVPRRTVVLAGPTSAVASAFGTQFQLYDSQIGTYQGRVGAIHLPQDLSERVEGVFGLDNRRQARTHAVERPPMPGAMSRAQPFGFTPPQIGRLYGFPDGQLDGAGECIGIIEFGGGYDRDDLAAYFGRLGLPLPEVVSVSVDGVDNEPSLSDDSPDGEVMLDIEVAGAIAPGAKIVVYFAPFTERGWVDVLSRAIHDEQHQPSIISISWGWPEANWLWTKRALRAVDGVLREAAALGITVCCASGDDGSADELTDGRAHVDFPASSPHILSCGGTTLRVAGGRLAAEWVWNDGPRSVGGGASGGGVSQFFSLPAWQTIVGVPPSLNGGRLGRGVPDVAGDADPGTGYIVRVHGRDTVIGGTSAVAPLWAGLIARINQHLGQPLGYLNPLLPQLVAAGGFQDITVGTNDTTGWIGGYPAHSGWDACTGWGRPIGDALLSALQVEPDAQLAQALSAGVGVAWLPFMGLAVDLEIGADGSIWAVSTLPTGAGYAVCRWNGVAWEGAAGAAVHIGVGPDGAPWTVDGLGQVFRWDAGRWSQLPGKAHDIAVGADGTVWTVRAAEEGQGVRAQRWTGTAWADAEQLGYGPLPSAEGTGWGAVAVGPDGSPYIVNGAGEIFSGQGGTWAQLPGAARDLAVGPDGSVWAVGDDPASRGFGIYRWNGQDWQNAGGEGARITVAPGGLPWVVNDAGRIYRRR
jgi:kumamolisin